MRSLLAALALLLAACATDSVLQAGAEDDMRVAKGMAWSHTYEVHFPAGEGSELVGYLVEFFEVPLGVTDQRRFAPGTVLLQDLEFQTLAFITPGSHGYLFDPEGGSTDLGFAGRDQLVSEVFQRNGRPTYAPIAPGVAPPR